jgi:transposase
MKKEEMPKWVLKYQTVGTQAVKIGNNYYLYKVTSKWNPRKGRSQKITEKYLGKITSEGVIKSKHERIKETLKNITVKEYGATHFIIENNRDIIDLLKNIYPEVWKEIFIFSTFRLIHSSPIKSIQEHYSTSYISEIFKNTSLSPKLISNLLEQIGKERERIKTFLKHFVIGTKFAIIDLTYIFSFSENIVTATKGYNSKREFLPQINLTLLFSLDKHQPTYFRILPGCIRDVSSLILTIEESGVKDVVVIGDKGFYSEDNAQAINDINKLENKNIKYLFPLRRNLFIIDYKIIEKGDKRAFDGYFLFNGRPIWYYCYFLENQKNIIVFLDERLKAEEEKDFLYQAEADKEKLEKFFIKQHTLGTIAVITSLNETPERVYELLKCRIEIETAFDTFKNILNADRAYMHSDNQMEGWMFINFIALIFYYRIYNLLSDKKMLKKYSSKDVLTHLSRIYKLRISNEWVTSEIPKKTRKIIENIGIPIT